MVRPGAPTMRPNGPKMKGYSRGLVMVAVVAALMLAFTVQIRRGDQLPAPPTMMAWVTAPPSTPNATAAQCPVDGRDCLLCCAAAPCAPPRR